MRNRYAIVAVLLAFQPIHGYLYRAVVLRKWLDTYDRYHYFIGLGDYHIKQHNQNEIQRKMLECLFAQSEITLFRVFTEDLSVPNVHGNFGCRRYYVNSRGGFLGGITDQLSYFGLDVDNLEYRYARVCSLGPVINHHADDPYSFPSVADITTHDVAQEVESVCQQITAYDDGQLLNAWYQDCACKVDQKMAVYGLSTACNSMSMADYLTRTKYRLRNIKQLLTFDCALLDAKIVHETVQSVDKERVCAIAGGSHIERASLMLQRVGYQPLLNIGPIYHHNGLERCLQLEQSRSQVVLPEPLCLDQLKGYF